MGVISASILLQLLNNISPYLWPTMLPDLSISLSPPRHQFYGTLLCLNQSSYPESALLLSVYVSTTRSAQPFSTNPLDSFPTHLDPLLSRKSFFSFFCQRHAQSPIQIQTHPRNCLGHLTRLGWPRNGCLVAGHRPSCRYDSKHHSAEVVGLLGGEYLVLLDVVCILFNRFAAT